MATCFLTRLNATEVPSEAAAVRKLLQHRVVQSQEASAAAETARVVNVLQGWL